MILSMKYIDIHCHLNSKHFDLDKNEVITRAREKEVGMIIVGFDYESSEKAVKIAEENENIWASIGLHPDEGKNEKFDFDKYKKLAMNEKVVAIGECGLDYYREGYDKGLQKEIFIKQIEIANQVNKPLMLHIRNAYEDALEILNKYSKVKGNVHFFAGNWEIAKKFLGLGFYLSFTGVITFARDYDEVIKNIPLDMIMTETDSPYVTPISYRGQRNEPAYVIEVAETIAKIKNENVDKVLLQLIDNARKLFLNYEKWPKS